MKTIEIYTKIICLLFFSVLSCSKANSVDTPKNDLSTMVVASYNIRWKNGEDKNERSWENRKTHLVNILKKYKFDIFGAQEALLPQISDILALCPEYAFFGEGRDGGANSGEYCPILYKKDKYKVLEKGQFWLSSTPDVPSKGWDASLNRICTWGKFEEIATGKQFYFFNTHLDHIGITARPESAKLIVDKIRNIAGTSTCFLTGDMNSLENSVAIQTFIKSGLVRDARQYSSQSPKGTRVTVNNYDFNLADAIRIDYIFSSNAVTVQSFQTINDDLAVGIFASDHFPVCAEVKF